MLSGSFDQWLEREWLLTNSRGGFASSTIIGCPTRREHGWMVWNQPGPRIERWMLWSHAAENLSVDSRTYLLANFEFNNAVDPHGYRHLSQVEMVQDDPAPRIRWTYRPEGAVVRRTLYVVDGTDVVIARYQVQARADAEIRLQMWPMVAARPLNSLRRRTAGELMQMTQDGPGIGMVYRLDPRVTLSLLGRRIDGGPPMEFHARGDWWYNFRYRREAERGLEFGEDLMVPGTFVATGRGSLDVELVGVGGTGDLREAWRQIRQIVMPPDDTPLSKGAVLVECHGEDAGPECQSEARSPDAVLRRAARQFPFRQPHNEGAGCIGMIAGFPWLGEYCRDACVSIPGLLLRTGRFDEARELLLRIALLRRDGGLPSHLSDEPAAHEYVTADAGLWFIYAVDAYLAACGDTGPAATELLKAATDIVQALAADAKKGMHLDADGLLACDDPAFAATWMDARYAWVFSTPRTGKPVEVNALWYHALCSLTERLSARSLDDGDSASATQAEFCQRLANRVRASFASVFWNAKDGCLFDVVGADGPDPAWRPNQIFAVSLRHSPLGDSQQASVVQFVQKHLLTPFGLRTLAVGDPEYRGHYEGNVELREHAAHEGSVYAWLMGPFVEAYLRMHGGDDRAPGEARRMLEPLIEHAVGSGCLLGISELFDGDAPHAPRGGISQAWCVAEVLRAWEMTKDPSDDAAVRGERNTSNQVAGR